VVELDEVSIWFTKISEIALAQLWMLAGEYGIEQDANPVSTLALSTVDSQGNPVNAVNAAVNHLNPAISGRKLPLFR
jgi:hypothetical protein